MNRKHEVPWLDRNKLRAALMYEGYTSYAPLADIWHVSEKTVRNKICYGRIDHIETLAAAKALKLSPQLYCEIFCADTFNEHK